MNKGFPFVPVTVYMIRYKRYCILQPPTCLTDALSRDGLGRKGSRYQRRIHENALGCDQQLTGPIIVTGNVVLDHNANNRPVPFTPIFLPSNNRPLHDGAQATQRTHSETGSPDATCCTFYSQGVSICGPFQSTDNHDKKNDRQNS
jgi:hypothetical protein